MSQAGVPRAPDFSLAPSKARHGFCRDDRPKPKTLLAALAQQWYIAAPAIERRQQARTAP